MIRLHLLMVVVLIGISLTKSEINPPKIVAKTEISKPEIASKIEISQPGSPPKPEHIAYAYNAYDQQPEMKCANSDDSHGFQHNTGRTIFNKHNSLRRRVGRTPLKWSNSLEYMAWFILDKSSSCSHAATDNYANKIFGKYSLLLATCYNHLHMIRITMKRCNISLRLFVAEHGKNLECQSNWLGHFENIAIGSPNTGVQRWINEGPENGDGRQHGHYENMVNEQVKWIGCWQTSSCLKCLYWGA